MMTQSHNDPTGWDESVSKLFIDNGKYFVPDRDFQIRTICDLIPSTNTRMAIIDLCCGEGLLSGALLKRFPNCRVYGYDGSREMLNLAAQNLSNYKNRFVAQGFNLAEKDWRNPGISLNAIVSSLCIHHLSANQKQELYVDIFRILAPGGVFIIADLVQPASNPGVKYAADSWDACVWERANEIDDDSTAFSRFEDLRWNFYRYGDEDNLDKPSGLLEQLIWLKDAGYTGVDVFWMKAGHVIFGGYKKE
ncbi:class I SAM-dependent methyltransferase [Chloroflexota bacterium]